MLWTSGKLLTKGFTALEMYLLSLLLWTPIKCQNSYSNKMQEMSQLWLTSMYSNHRLNHKSIVAVGSTSSSKTLHTHVMSLVVVSHVVRHSRANRREMVGVMLTDKTWFGVRHTHTNTHTHTRLTPTLFIASTETVQGQKISRTVSGGVPMLSVFYCICPWVLSCWTWTEVM